MHHEIIRIDYGKTGLELDIHGLNATILRPHYPAPLEYEAAAFAEAAHSPFGGVPLRDRIASTDSVAVVIPDITRALPNERLLEWVFQELSHVPARNFTIISGTGSHRANTPDEWITMVGPTIYRDYHCIDHDGHNPDTLVHAGDSPFGYPVHFNRHYVEADRRILLGFIEPHFMAGFSGGFKAAFPGVTGVETILDYHSAANIGHPQSTWGIIEGNPTQDHVRAGGSLLPVDFLLNVTLDNQRRITGFFCGDVLPAHDAGCAFCKETAMIPCEFSFPITVTSNSGYPLDQNLYQTVKGMSAAAGIQSPGGRMLVASRCNDGFPAHGNFRRLLTEYPSPLAMLNAINSPQFRVFDQWQVQLLALILEKARVGIYCEIPDEDLRSVHLEPVADLRAAIEAELDRLGDTQTPIAILPEGPLTIPYVKGIGS